MVPGSDSTVTGGVLTPTAVQIGILANVGIQLLPDLIYRSGIAGIRGRQQNFALVTGDVNQVVVINSIVVGATP
jgi:hypothetical protein